MFNLVPNSPSNTMARWPPPTMLSPLHLVQECPNCERVNEMVVARES
jgi:hypothetical protein